MTRQFYLQILMFAALAAVALAETPPPPAPAQGVLTLETQQIELDDGRTVEAERGVLKVPGVRAKPESKPVEVEIYRFRALEGAPAGVPPIFLLHGGPGWPGLGRVLDKAEYHDERLRPFRELADLVVVGQRGIGSSLPNTMCAPPAKPAPDAVLDQEQLAELYGGASSRCREFWQKQGYDLSGFNVVEAAADVADSAAALGYERIVLWGISFGSHWSMAVMRYHPQLVARAVLGGLEGPDHTYDMPGDVLKAFERIAAAAEADPRLAPHIPEGGLLRAFRTVVARAEKEPLTVKVETEGGEAQTVRFAAEEVREMISGTTRSARSWSRLESWPREILQLYRGNFDAPARRKLDEGSGFPTASFFMLDCGSGISRQRAARLAADPAKATVGDLGQVYNLSCPVWGSDLGESFRRNFDTDIPTLLVHGDWDLSTPYENALDLEPHFRRGKLVTVEGGTHGALADALSHVDGFREAVAHFVRTGELDQVPKRVSMPPIEWQLPEPSKEPELAAAEESE